MITADGIAVHIGTREEQHPIYHTPSFALRAELQLEPEALALYRDCTEGDEGIARLHIRSALAQVGLDAFHPLTTNMWVTANLLVIDSLMTCFNGESGARVIECMRRMIDTGQKPRMMHMGLFRHDARVTSAHGVRSLVKEGVLFIDGSDVYEDGSIGLAPIGPLYRFGQAAYEDEAVQAIIQGEGRATLQSLREESESLPEQMMSHDFLVTGVGVQTRDHHVVLRREVLTGGVHAKVVHGESCILQAGRTRGGSRQLELWNANGKPQAVADLRVVADLYRADEVVEPGH